MNKPELLYHGSLYKQDELMPGFKRSGELVMWDGIESNQYLYATSSEKDASYLGIGSAIEKLFDSDRYATVDRDITIYCQNNIDKNDILKMVVYVYTIPFRDSDKWIKNNNPHNSIDTEWITKNTIHDITVKKLDIGEFLKGARITVTKAPVDVDPLNIMSQYRSVTERYLF
ncbi:hypothetical protein [Pseudomonas aeruginosa]|uniref:hypothetical protein n=1 Tax=Pseudomonas aeruginosa TaxID=287 RepID=UPI001CA4B388|nr:hypothetical protein [Pseudomonas aeruginosa]MBW6069692.1 hypothetical protein [Pseudomonas aeruginosa]